jgi:hypothetical protein
MAVYKRTYKAYTGALTPQWSRFLVLSRFSFATLFDSRLFTAFTVLCFVPFLIGFAFIYISHSLTAQLILGLSTRNPVPIDGTWFVMYLAVQSWLGFFLTAWCAPGLISQDLANNALPLYLSRPLSRPEYLLGKIMVLATLLRHVDSRPGSLSPSSRDGRPRVGLGQYSDRRGYPGVRLVIHRAHITSLDGVIRVDEVASHRHRGNARCFLCRTRLRSRY